MGPLDKKFVDPTQPVEYRIADEARAQAAAERSIIPTLEMLITALSAPDVKLVKRSKSGGPDAEFGADKITEKGVVDIVAEAIKIGRQRIEENPSKALQEWMAIDPATLANMLHNGLFLPNRKAVTSAMLEGVPLNVRVAELLIKEAEGRVAASLKR